MRRPVLLLGPTDGRFFLALWAVVVFGSLGLACLFVVVEIVRAAADDDAHRRLLDLDPLDALR